VSAPVDWVPLVDLLPVQPPDAVQVVALVVLQVRAELAPAAMLLGVARKLTVGAADVTETVAD
jgi:hypothetical protein